MKANEFQLLREAGALDSVRVWGRGDWYEVEALRLDGKPAGYIETARSSEPRKFRTMDAVWSFLVAHGYPQERCLPYVTVSFAE